MPSRNSRDRRNKRSGRHGGRKPQRAEEKALKAASFHGMLYKLRHPSHVRSFADQERFRGDRLPTEVGPDDSFLSPDSGSFLSPGAHPTW
jgi:hypothetical protein